MPEIQRVDAYCDHRFSQTVLFQHGAFLVDGEPYEVEIIGKDSAKVKGPRRELYAPLIEEFRFFAEHISRFYDQTGALIAEFPPVRLFPLKLSKIQPSQFYVDEDKLQAVRTFLFTPEDIIVPVIQLENRYVSLDGHTRLAAAVDAGYDSIYAFCSKSDDYIFSFVEEAKKRGVFSPRDLKRVSHKEYEIVWNQFCDDFFKRRNQAEEGL